LREFDNKMAEPKVSNYRTMIARFNSSGQWDRTVETAREWLSVEPENIDAHMAAGQALVVLNHHTEAERHIAHVLTAQPDNDIAHRHMSAIQFATGRYKAADESVRKAISLDPTDAFHWYHLALMCYRQGDRASAKKFGSKALELRPRDPDIMNLVTLCEPTDFANPDQKLAQYRAALALDPENAAIHNNIGALYLDAKHDYQTAEECFRRALFFDPSGKTYRKNLFITIKHRDPIYRALRAPKDFLLKAFSFTRKARQQSIILYLVSVPLWLLAFRFVLGGLILWCIFIWPLIKAYEFLMIGDILSKAGELGARRGGFLGYRRWPLKLRLGIFAALLLLFWGGIAVLWLSRDSLAKSDSFESFLGLCIFCGLFALLIFIMRGWSRKSRIESHARRRAKKFDALLNPKQIKRPWWQFWQRRTQSQ
jgi:tetratricopeptide (TPR) repeat protein